jgi:hypothetical protein
MAGKLKYELKKGMKKNILIIAVITFCSACNGNGKVDETKLNEAGEKLQKTVQKGTDSIGAKLKRLKNKIDTTHADTSKY